jgi:hypothetical protein
MKTTKLERLAKKAKKVLEQLEKAKDLYKLKEQLTDEIQSELKKENLKSFPLGDGQQVEIVDNFVEKNIKWKMAAFSRFEIKLTNT